MYHSFLYMRSTETELESRENKATENASIPLLCMVLNCGSCLLNVDNGSILLFNHSSHLTNMLSITRKRDLRISLTSLNN